MSELIAENIRTMQSVANSPQVKAFMKDAQSAGGSTDTESIISYLQAVDATLADDNSTVLTGADGMQLARSKGDCVDVSSRDYYGEAMAGHIYVSDVVVSKTTGSRIVVPVVPIYDTDGTTILGFIQRNFNISILHDFVKNAAEAEQTLVLTDRNGTVIAHSQHEIKAEDPDDDRSSTAYFTGAKSGTPGTIEEKINGKTMILSYQMEPVTGWVVVVERDYDKAMSRAVGQSMIIVVIGIVLIILAAVIAFVMSKSITGPVAVVSDSMDAMSQGRFDRIDAYADRKDEFGVMISAANSLSDMINDIVAQIRDSADSVSRSSEELADTASQIADTTDGIADAVQEVASGATQQADEIQSANENTARISENIAEVTQNATRLRDEASQMSVNSKESADLMRKLRNITQEMGKSIDDITQKISSTSDAVGRISGKVEAINAIASQTNLLALNASIEAARAGEAGRGFAVVAEEISKLADDSSGAANEIHREMSTLVSESRAAVEQAEGVKNATNEQMDALTAAIDSIKELIKEIEGTVDGVDTIMDAAVACDDSKTIVVEAMSSLSAISEENAASSEETSASTQELSATVTTLASTADSLRGISEELVSRLDFFK